MIKEKTTFIIGAGASNPYGYPTGGQLREKICKDTCNKVKLLLPHSKTHEIDKNYKSDIYDKLIALSEVFYKSSTPSIDLFLSRNLGYANIGKLAIIIEILEAERNSQFREDIVQSDQDWYSYLYRYLTDGIIYKDNYKEFSKNNISFITFNYDRSLEYFLHESFLNSFNYDVDRTDLTNEVKNIFLEHVYGVVAPLPWQDIINYSSLEYKSEFNIQLVQSLIKNIKMIHERTLQDLRRITKRIQEAQRIFFLGFGYANENLEILDIPKVIGSNTKIFGTVKGFCKRELNEIKGRFLPMIKESKIILEDCNCLELLRDYL